LIKSLFGNKENAKIAKAAKKRERDAKKAAVELERQKKKEAKYNVKLEKQAEHVKKLQEQAHKKKKLREEKELNKPLTLPRAKKTRLILSVFWIVFGISVFLGYANYFLIRGIKEEVNSVMVGDTIEAPAEKFSEDFLKEYVNIPRTSIKRSESCTHRRGNRKKNHGWK
jgi:Fe2+ transport system protein B